MMAAPPARSAARIVGSMPPPVLTDDDEFFTRDGWVVEVVADVGVVRGLWASLPSALATFVNASRQKSKTNASRKVSMIDLHRIVSNPWTLPHISLYHIILLPIALEK
jgi:hypothetical protein